MPIIIAGPCSAETKQQVISTAYAISKISGVDFFRAGLWKPRTNSGQFEGVGENGIPWLQEVAQKTSLKVLTEVVFPKHVEAIANRGLAGVWLGTRTVVNPFLVEELAKSLNGTNLLVMVKNPINPDIKLWCGAIERLKKQNVKNIFAIHRGFSINKKNKLRYPPIWSLPLELRKIHPDIPIICDPSHISGNADYISSVSHKALSLNFAGLMIESHINPEQALTDRPQQLDPVGLSRLVNSLGKEKMENNNTEEELIYLREKINEIDSDLLDALSQRQLIVNEIAKFKISKNIPVVQHKRIKELLVDRVHDALDLNLSSKYIQSIFNLIHEESVRIQNEVSFSLREAKIAENE